MAPYLVSEFYTIGTKDITAHKQEAQIQWDITGWIQQDEWKSHGS